MTRKVLKINSSIFSTINRFPGLFENYPHIDYNAQTTFAYVARGHEHEFVSACKKRNIQFMTYPPHFQL
jgi:hypothetical protein